MSNKEEKSTIRTVMDENPDEADTYEDNVDTEEAPARLRIKFRRQFYFAVGIIFTVMTIIGTISTVKAASSKIYDLINNTEQKTFFARTIYPLVLCDPPPFDTPTKLRNEMLITASCWDIILNSDKSVYEQDFDYIKVPAADIEQHAADLFGSGVTVKHTSVITSDLQFYYDMTGECYRIPSNPKFFSYSPRIDSITKNGDVYTLQVGYIAPAPSWIAEFNDEAPEPEKYVEYSLLKQNDGYIILSVNTTEYDNGSENGL